MGQDRGIAGTTFGIRRGVIAKILTGTGACGYSSVSIYYAGMNDKTGVFYWWGEQNRQEALPVYVTDKDKGKDIPLGSRDCRPNGGKLEVVSLTPEELTAKMSFEW